MAKKRNFNEKTNDIIRKNLDEQIEEIKMDIVKKNKTDEASKTKKTREEFDIFWSKKKNKYKNYGDIADIVWSHLVAYGFDSPEKFEEGIKHFGLN